MSACAKSWTTAAVARLAKGGRTVPGLQRMEKARGEHPLSQTRWGEQVARRFHVERQTGAAWSVSSSVGLRRLLAMRNRSFGRLGRVPCNPSLRARA
jgi:hypothetical protein